MLRARMSRFALRFALAFVVALSVFAASTVLAPGTAQAAGGKRIVVNLATQRLYAYSGSKLAASMPVHARGTARGTFRVLDHIGVAGSIYRGWLLPYWMGIYYVGRVENGIHGPERIGKYTATNSLGCVVILSMANAAWLYAWAPGGTPVVIQ